MQELHKILTDNLLNDNSFSINLDGTIPKTSIWIFKSETMIPYGIGKQNEPGFTLNVRIDNHSKKGKRIVEALTVSDTLKDFKTFPDKRATTYLHDFKTDVDAIVHKTNWILDRLKSFRPDVEVKLIVRIASGWFTIE